MKPSAEAKHLGAPAFQMAKGTRRINVSGDWCDMREDDLRFADESFHETLLATALREGREEIGLKRENVRRMFDMGGFTFVSASKGIRKPLHMFAAEIIDPADFAPYEKTTAEVRWMHVSEFDGVGRADHHLILKEMLERLQEYVAGK